MDTHAMDDTTTGDTVEFMVDAGPFDTFPPGALDPVVGKEAALEMELHGRGFSIEAPTVHVRIVGAVIDPDRRGATLTVARA